MDADLRSDERRAATGDPDAAARALLGRVRSGDVSAEALEVAARLGSADALRALDRAPPAVPEDLGWLNGLAILGAPIIVRVLVAAVRHVLPAFEVLAPGDLRPTEALAAAAAWADHPSQALASAAKARSRAAMAAADELGRKLPPFQGDWFQDEPELFRAYHAACAAKQPGEWAFVADRDARILSNPDALVNMVELLRRAGAQPAALWAAVSAEVVPWAVTPRAARSAPA